MSSLEREHALSGSESFQVLGRSGWIVTSLTAFALGLIFYSGLALMMEWWSNREEYSHGWLIPPIAAFLIWQKRDELQRLTFSGSWIGVGLVLFGLLVWLAGELSTLYTVVQYAFLITLAGAVLAYMGWKPMRLLWVALFILVFMVPLPNFLYNNLSQKLQLMSSAIGVWLIRLFDISVYLEGNVIDLGNYKLQVVEACSGLRYLFPLMTLGVIVAVFFRAPLWQRLVLFLSTMPITVLMNSFRIGVIGVLVDKWGTEQAEGFLHDFEGWVIFMACFALLFLEMWLLVRLSGDKRPFRDIFALELPPPLPKDRPVQYRKVPLQAWVATGLLVAAVVPALMLPERVEAIPKRSRFADFPMQVAGWQGQPERMEQIYVDALKFSDYIIANYSNGNAEIVNFYVAWYESQRKGESVHSPKSCLPGGGWVIQEFGQREVAGATVGGQPLRVNRTLIQQGAQRQLVYYWFQQRGRNLTNEYVVKWFLFWDALTKNRSDGALVRIITPLKEGEEASAADGRLVEFTRGVVPLLGKYVPD